MPNWNSMTRPVATPIAKLIRSSVPKNLVSRSQVSSPERYHSVCMTATSGASPSVSGTNRKWESAVVANWIRERSRAVEATVMRTVSRCSAPASGLAHREPSDTLVRERGPHPVDHALGAVLGRRQQRQMHRRPGHLRLRAGHRPAGKELDARGPTPDCRHRALVLVREGLRLLPCDPARDRLAGVLSRLQRHRPELGQDLLALRIVDR